MTSDSPAHERPLATSSEPVYAEATPEAESTALQRMRLERDSALEDLTFLREQLRSTEAFYAHRFELAYERLHTEHRSLLDALTRASEPIDAPPVPRTR